MKNFLISLPQWSCTIVAMLLLLYLTLVPKPLPDTDMLLFPHADKVVHAIMFGGIYFCLVLDYLRQQTKRNLSLMLPLSLNVAFALASIALGGAIELLQGGVGRSCDILDFYADAAGVAVFFTFSKQAVCKLLK